MALRRSGDVRSAVRSLVRSVPPLEHGLLRFRFGDLRRTEPMSRWGSARGTPVDRTWIVEFLESHADGVRGRVLEVKEDLYASRFGACEVDVVDLDTANPLATLVGDLCDPATLPPARFDAAIVTHTLQYVRDPSAAVRHLLASLCPGGMLLITVPTVMRVDGPSDRWRWTPHGLSTLLEQASPPGATVSVVGYGNGLGARAFLFGLAAEDLQPQALGTPDPAYPVMAGGLVRVPS